MEERRITGTTGEAVSDADAETEGIDARQNGRGSRIASVEEWTPPAPVEGAATVRQYLTPGESLRLVDGVAQLDGAARPASVGLTDQRLVLVADDGGFVGVDFDRICAVRSDLRTTIGVNGTDYRLLLGAGYLLAILGLVGLLAAAANPLTPTFALVTVGGVLASAHVLREGVDFEPALAELHRHDGDTGLADRLERGRRRLNERAADEDVALGVTGGLAAGSFLLVLGLEGGVVAPVLTLLIVAGAGLMVFAFRHRETFDGMEIVRRRMRRVHATVEDGSVVVVRTHPDSTLDRKLSGLVHGRSPPRQNEAADR